MFIYPFRTSDEARYSQIRFTDSAAHFTWAAIVLQQGPRSRFSSGGLNWTKFFFDGGGGGMLGDFYLISLK